MRAVTAGLIVALALAGAASSGRAGGDAAPPPGQGAAGAAGETADETAGCSACTLRHRSMTRRADELRAAEEARGDCQIKGDVTAEGERLYFRLDAPDYAWVWISEAAGDRWFCSAEEAEAAGWRPAVD